MNRSVSTHSSVPHVAVLALVACGGVFAQSDAAVEAEVTEVVSRPLERSAVLPGELRAFQSVELYAKVSGFVEEIAVDRGSRVKQGQLLVRMTAPEIEARRVEAEAKIPAAMAQRIEAEAKLAAAQSTFERLTKAAETPGVVAGNDLILAEKSVDAEKARVDALAKTVEAYEASVRALAEIERYLEVRAPFDGVITERFAHAGTLAGPEGDGRRPLLRIEQLNVLRLVAPVPEAYTQSIRRGASVSFTVAAHPGETFSGVVSRPAFSLDASTRTMPVELDVRNPGGRLAPGMYAEIRWPVSRQANSLFVPPSAIKSTTERVFVIRVRNGAAEWVDVRRGMSSGGMVEVFGELEAGDRILVRGNDEIRPGTRIQPPRRGGAG